jgi:hypothetical protein
MWMQDLATRGVRIPGKAPLGVHLPVAPPVPVEVTPTHEVSLNECQPKVSLPR